MKKGIIVFSILAALGVVTVLVATVLTHSKNKVYSSDVSTAQLEQVSAPTPTVVISSPEIRKGNQKATILVYHSIEPATNKKEGKMQKHYHIYPENFKAQMQYLKDNGYQVISMATYLDHLKQGIGFEKKSVVLTFDDGWHNQYQYAFPILKEFGYTGTFYIISNVRNGGYMTWDQVIELDKAGMDIQSHSATHPRLTDLDVKKLEQELVGSKKALEEKLGHSISQIAYPYYANNDQVRLAVEAAGYGSARAGWTKLPTTWDSRFQLQSQEAINNKNPFSTVIEK